MSGGGSNFDENMVTLCSNCYNCIESLYDEDFIERLFQLYSQYHQLPPNELPGRLPCGPEYNVFGNFTPASEDFYPIVEAISLCNNTFHPQVAQATDLTEQ